jgi:hypothetical protein
LLPAATERILATLADDARVLDVGGWAAPFNRATHVLDLAPYSTRGVMGSYGPGPERFSEATWAIQDICARDPWPYEDDCFDFALCVTTLEDVRDPIGVCRELSRVAKAGYVEMPTIYSELCYNRLGNGPWLGYSHHRWFCEREGDGLLFWHKDPGVHFDWRVRVLPRWQETMTLDDHLFGVFWEGELAAREYVYSIDEHDAVLDRLAGMVRERFDPPRSELALKALRERARHVAGQAKAPARRAMERVLSR